MAGPALKEIQGIPTGENTKIVHLPTQETEWRKRVVQHTQQVVPSYTTEQATPSAAYPIPDSDALKHAKAERVGAEPPFSFSDITHGVNTLGTAVGGVAPDTYDRTIPGNNVISLVKEKERARRLFQKKKAA